MNCIANPGQNGKSFGSAATPEPHFIPGYAGYVPQSKFKPGNTFGMTSHRILLDPCIHMSPKSILNKIQPEHCTDDFGRYGLGADPLMQAQMALINSRANSFGQIQPDRTAGYAGFIPRFQTILGHTYSPSCNRATSAFEQDQWRDKLFTKELEALDGWKCCHKTKPWETPEVQSQQYSPCCKSSGSVSSGGGCSGGCGCSGGAGEFQSTGSYGNSQSPGSPSGGCGCERTAEYTLLNRERPCCDYGDRRMFGCATDQILQPTAGDIVPRLNAFRISRPPVDRIQQIYRGCEGLIPNYMGHIPGERFIIARTFTASTRNARRAIEPVYHKPLCYPLTFNNI